MAKKPTNRRKKSTRKSAPSNVDQVNAIQAEVEDKRPEYVVLFADRKTDNAGVISQALGVKQFKGMKTRSGCVVMSANHEWAAKPRVYERLNVAVVDLDADEHERLRKDTRVRHIAKNEIRRIPPIIISSEHAGVDDQPLPQDFPFAASEMADPQIAYVAGIRDAASVILKSLVKRQPNPVMELGPKLASRAGHSWCLDLLGIEDGYKCASGKDVTVAVLDTGIDLHHPDFAGRFDDANTKSFIPGESVQDGNGHGTHCAGVIGASVNTAGRGRYAAAPDVELLIGKVMSDGGVGYDDQILAGIDWAFDTGANIVSMSLGAQRGVGQPYPQVYESIAQDYLAADPGMLIIAAAGNESQRPFFTEPVGNPAACPSISAVAAIDRRKKIASFSCREMDAIGDVTFSAPGVAVYSSWIGGGFKSISGTSMATPYVAALAALYWELDPDASASEILSKLKSSCIALGDQRDFGLGLVQAP